MGSYSLVSKMPMIPETPEHQTVLIVSAVMGPIGVCLATICCQKTFCKPKPKPVIVQKVVQRDWAGERQAIIDAETRGRGALVEEWQRGHSAMKVQEREAFELLSEVTMEF